MFTTVKNVCSSYYDHLPQNTFQTVGKSALYSFTFCIIFVTFPKGGNQIGKMSDLSRPLVAGGIAALASSVHALMTPLFDLAFGDRKVKSYREGIKWVVVSVVTSILLSGLTTHKVDLQAIRFIIPLAFNFCRGVIGIIPETISCFDDDQDQNGDNLTKQMQGLGVLPEEGSNSIYFIPNSPF